MVNDHGPSHPVQNYFAVILLIFKYLKLIRLGYRDMSEAEVLVVLC
jgi:hypothetical protein